jgi:hypothetical protein
MDKDRQGDMTSAAKYRKIYKQAGSLVQTSVKSTEYKVIPQQGDERAA